MANGRPHNGDQATEETPLDAARIGRIEANHESLAANVTRLTEDVRELAKTTNRAIQDTQMELRSVATLLSQKIDGQNKEVMDAIRQEHTKSDERETNRTKSVWPIVFGAIGVASSFLTVFISSETRPLAADIRKADDTIRAHESRLDRIEERRGDQAVSIARIEQWREDYEKYIAPQLKGKP